MNKACLIGGISEVQLQPNQAEINPGEVIDLVYIGTSFKNSVAGVQAPII